VQAGLDVIAARLGAAYPKTNGDARISVTTESRARQGRLVPIAAMLLSIVGLVLAVGCANVAGLLAAIVVWALGASGLLLSAIGLYGLISFVVARRTREIGIRLALGVGRIHIWRDVVGHSLSLALWGVGAGAAGAFVVSRLLAGSLYGVSAADPLSFASVIAGVMVVAVVAARRPASRAMRVDPVKALRAE
jgi:ABC-type antimicrobial peptide transport system permease subunit